MGGLVAFAAKDTAGSSTAGVVPTPALQSPTLANQQLQLPQQPLVMKPPQQPPVMKPPQQPLVMKPQQQPLVMKPLQQPLVMKPQQPPQVCKIGNVRYAGT